MRRPARHKLARRAAAVALLLPLSLTQPLYPTAGAAVAWRQTFVENFDRTVPVGSFPGAYGKHWLSYDGFADSSGAGDYESSIISAHDGVLDLHLHAQAGRPKVAAPVPLVGGKWGGQLYGRFSVRMKADPLKGYGVAFLLWSDANDWNDGEIDFPESRLDDVVWGFNHCPGNPADNCHWFTTNARYSDWHTYTIEWTATSIRYRVDGHVVSSTNAHIPTKPMHWVLQVETPDASKAAQESGHLLIDRVEIAKPT